MIKGYVYILRDSKNTFYVGSTLNLENRLKAHLSGSTRTTKKMSYPKLVLSQEYESIMIARKIERRIKNLKRKDYLEKMVEDGYIKLKV